MKKYIILGLTAALSLAGCSNMAEAEPTTRERLEAQGVIYSDGDWEEVTEDLCRVKFPDVYMGVSDSLERNKKEMNDLERLDAMMSLAKGGRAPNANSLTDREKNMVIDLVRDNECGSGTDTAWTVK